MSLGVGPLDGRKARRSRCEACARRKIKCHGGSPCEYCRRTSQSCTWPARARHQDLVFVHQNIPIGNSLLPCSAKESDLAYFVNSFLPANLLSNRGLLRGSELQSLLHLSPALEDAIRAIAVLHRYSGARKMRVETAKDQRSHTALVIYSRSVKSIQRLIAASSIAGEPHALWATFLLGLFELMRDATGANWIAHFLHGTCTMLRLQNPTRLIQQDEKSEQIRNFFLATRIFEIARALIYTSPTFLSDPLWTDAVAMLWQIDGAAVWHPKEALFDILPRFSDLAIRTMQFVTGKTEDNQLPDQAVHEQALATEGLILKEMLLDWQNVASQRGGGCTPQKNAKTENDVDMLIALLYFHAISIYLSGIFDYHLPWKDGSGSHAPILRPDEVEQHLHEIFWLSQKLLAAGAAGVLLFFPLRVAGARSRKAVDQKHIVDFFQETAHRGYSVAETFVTDLQRVWT